MLARNILLLGAAAVVCTGVAVTCGVLLFKDNNSNDGGSSSTSSLVEEEQQGSPAPFATKTSTTAMPSHPPSLLVTVPTLKPSAVPSLRPSATPSAQPSPSPSDTPTVTASNEPSQDPTGLPTMAPAVTATAAPTFAPTQTPASNSLDPTLLPSKTLEPTPGAPTGGLLSTGAPTFVLPNEAKAFRIKMHWEEDFFWQEETEERQYCITCCECIELNFSEFPEDFDCQSSYCAPGDQLWLRDCEDDYGAAFRMKRDEQDGIMLGVVESGRSTTVAGQCLTRTLKRYLQVQPCDSNDMTQRWRSISANREFPLISYHKHRQDKNETYCVTQHHHPKSYEILGFKDCPEANSDDTGEWVVVDVPDWYNV